MEKTMKTDLMLIIMIIFVSLLMGFIIGRVITKDRQTNPLLTSLSHLPAEKYLYDVEIGNSREAVRDTGSSSKKKFADCLELVKQSDGFQKELFKKQWLDEGGK